MATTFVKFATNLETALHAALKHYAIDSGISIQRITNNAIRDLLVRKKRVKRAPARFSDDRRSRGVFTGRP